MRDNKEIMQGKLLLGTGSLNRMYLDSAGVFDAVLKFSTVAARMEIV